MQLTIIIPTLNEEKALPETLENVAERAPGCELIVVDGGSTDRTREVAEAFTGFPLIWIDAPKGRGNQMNAGAARATGDVLLFLHADTHLPPDAPALLERALTDPRVIGGNFRIRFTPRTPLSDLYTWCYNARSHARIFYGDSALFIRRDAFERLGGYRAERLMEDIELVLRLRKAGKLAYIRAGTVVSSARRFHNTWTGLEMLWIWTLLHLLMIWGVKQETLERLYPEVR